MDLREKQCVSCEDGTTPLTEEEAKEHMKQLRDWLLWPDSKAISKSLKFKDFKQAFAFASKVAALAEEEGHHPDLSISWGRVEIELSTHSIGGLSENDFILAAKIDGIK